MAANDGWEEIPLNNKKDDGWEDVSHELQAPKEESSLRKYGRMGLEQLPIAGGIAGGLLASPGIVTTGLGAGVGMAAGKTLENLGKTYLLDEQITPEQNLKDVAMAFPEGIASEFGGQIAGKALGWTAKKMASGLSRIPEKVIETYAKRGKDVEELISKYGSDSQEAADAIRQQMSQKIQSFKNINNAKISAALEKKGGEVNINPILKTLEEAKAKLDPDFKTEDIAKIQGMIDKIYSISDESGIVPSSKAFGLQKFLQEQAEYIAPGQFYRRGGQSEIAATKAAAKVRGLVNAVEPEIKAANKELESLRKAEKNVNKNLFIQEKPSAGLIGAGSGTNAKNIKSLRNVGDIVGSDFLTPAENLAAQAQFANPGLLPGMNTGAIIPAAGGLGYGIKSMAEGNLGDAAMGLLTGAMGSPIGVKYGIKTLPISRGLIRGVPFYLSNQIGREDGR